MLVNTSYLKVIRCSTHLDVGVGLDMPQVSLERVLIGSKSSIINWI